MEPWYEVLYSLPDGTILCETLPKYRDGRTRYFLATVIDHTLVTLYGWNPEE